MFRGAVEDMATCPAHERKTPSSDAQFAEVFGVVLSKAYFAVLEGLLSLPGTTLPADAHMIAARSENAAAVLSYLRERGWLAHQEQLDGCLEVTCRRCDLEATRLLLQWGANAAAAPVLAEAVSDPSRRGAVEPLVALLLDAKADPMAHSQQGATAVSRLLTEFIVSLPGFLPQPEPDMRRQADAHSAIRRLLQQDHGHRTASREVLSALLKTAVVGDNAWPVVRALLRAGADPAAAGGMEALVETAGPCCVDSLLLHDGGACLREEVEGKPLALRLVENAFRKKRWEVAAVLLCHADGDMVPYDTLLGLLEAHAVGWLGYGRQGTPMLHALALFFHQHFPDAAWYPDLTDYTCYTHPEVPDIEYDASTVQGRDYLLDWHRRCPGGLDSAARRLLDHFSSFSSYTTEKVDKWLAAYRGVMQEALGAQSSAGPPCPLWTLVSVYV